MQMEPHKRNWEELAEVDPLWAILSSSNRSHGRWDLVEFFQTGEREVAAVMANLEQHHLDIPHGALLDFGCGVGRLTRAFASRFSTCKGVDISERMIENARQLNHDHPNCQFVVNTVDNLRIIPDDSIDMVYTNLVLQHVPQVAIIKAYIGEFVRILRPGGAAVFQLPSHIAFKKRLQPRRRAYGALRSLGVPHTVLYNRLGLNPMKMSYIAEPEVATTVRDAGGNLDFVETKETPEYVSSTYYVTKTQ